MPPGRWSASSPCPEFKSTCSTTDYSCVDPSRSAPDDHPEARVLLDDGSRSFADARTAPESGAPRIPAVVAEPGLRRLSPPAWLHRGIGVLIAAARADRGGGPLAGRRRVRLGIAVTGTAQRWAWGPFSLRVLGDAAADDGRGRRRMALGIDGDRADRGADAALPADVARVPGPQHLPTVAAQDHGGDARPLRRTGHAHPADPGAQRGGRSAATLASLEAQTRPRTASSSSPTTAPTPPSRDRRARRGGGSRRSATGQEGRRAQPGAAELLPTPGTTTSSW